MTPSSNLKLFYLTVFDAVVRICLSVMSAPDPTYVAGSPVRWMFKWAWWGAKFSGASIPLVILGEALANAKLNPSNTNNFISKYIFIWSLTAHRKCMENCVFYSLFWTSFRNQVKFVFSYQIKFDHQFGVSFLMITRKWF